MKKLAGTTFCTLLLTFPCFADESERVDPPWVERSMQPVVYSVPGMDDVKVTNDIAYSEVDGEPLKLDVYTPKSASGSTYPVVMYVYGGPVPASLKTKPKDWGAYMSHGKLAAASGFVGVVFNRRFNSYDDYPDSYSDVRSAIAFIRERAARFHADPDNIIVWAFSGGGAMLGPLATDTPAYIKALVGYYPLLDIRNLRELTQITLTQQQLEEYSLSHLVQNQEARMPPIFIARAGRETSPYIQASIDSFAANALKTNRHITFSNHPAGQHGFDIFDDNERSREILKQTIEFIRAHTQE